MCLGFPCKVMKFGLKCSFLAVNETAYHCVALSNKWNEEKDELDA